jgi:ferritin
VWERCPSYPFHFHNQAEEEKKHALRFIEHLIDVGAHVNIPTVPATQAPLQCPSKIR